MVCQFHSIPLACSTQANTWGNSEYDAVLAGFCFSALSMCRILKARLESLKTAWGIFQQGRKWHIHIVFKFELKQCT